MAPSSTPWSTASSVFFGHVDSHTVATLGSARKLDAVIHGVETCNLDAMLHDVDPLGPNLDLSHPRV